jgi:hypothetical protein
MVVLMIPIDVLNLFFPANTGIGGTYLEHSFKFIKVAVHLLSQYALIVSQRMCVSDKSTNIQSFFRSDKLCSPGNSGSTFVRATGQQIEKLGFDSWHTSRHRIF